MVLVARAARRRGIGTRLLRRTIDRVCDEGRIAGLDATELGRPVYLPLGFRDLYTVSRLRLETPAPAASTPAGCTIRPLTPADLADVGAFDTPRSGMQRPHVLAHLFGEASEHTIVAESAGRIVGFALGRPGRIAFQVGPAVADDEAVATALLSAAMARRAGPVMIDVPDVHAGLRARLESAGAVRQRGFTRMTLGEPPPGVADPSRIFALAGPSWDERGPMPSRLGHSHIEVGGAHFLPRPAREASGGEALAKPERGGGASRSTCVDRRGRRRH
jgi:ribosomal protein S18 acetylase RimI-like enzyme